MSRVAHPLYNALIRTHHITSRKKVANLRKAADHHGVYALLCSGGCPGIMYAEGSPNGVREWVSSVNVSAHTKSRINRFIDIPQRLRYKDYQLAVRPAPIEPEHVSSENRKVPVGLFEVGTVKEFGAIMQERGVWSWWRKGMGYVSDD
ncbi:hypothetical protein MPH_03952 [Macrophomina phaseolina MS6]|uniref:Uncharacterized protein n=1 Tax=Macrophomina phaseolina (strain MS6) TaxID=1126212 RepID=K2R8N8_MACPH|nr:hypothetical protein MPH_03952 [Macrophomina phaseolina MS6]